MKSIRTVGMAVLVAAAVSGCVPVIGAMTLSDLMTGASLVSTGLTGKSLGEHALSAATGEDCSLMEAALQKDRHVCEVADSKATRNDFKGLIGMAQATPTSPQPAANVAAAANTGAPQTAADPPRGPPAAEPRTTADLRPGEGAAAWWK